MWKDSVAHYVLNGIESTLQLEEDLKSGAYKARPPITFKITSPKEREIVSIAFRDRVYQRSLNDNVVYPAMSRSFIRDNCACQSNKGTDYARERLKCFMQRYYRKHGVDGYALKCDIQGYYPNMNHEIVEELFRSKLDTDTAERVITILRSQYPGDTGYNPGSQIVQIAGIALLDGLDHYIKERLHVKHYLRYMDDFILIHHNRQFLEECRCQIEQQVRRVKCELHPTKTRIEPLSAGISFLGFTFRLTDTGKVLMLLDSDNVRRERRKLRRLIHKAYRGRTVKERVDNGLKAWKAHAKHGNIHGIVSRMDTYYNQIWRNLDEDFSEQTQPKGTS